MNLVDTIVQGVLLGGLYALFAAGLSLVFGIMRLVNLAHGDLIVLAAFLILVLVTALGLNPFVAALVAMPVMFAVGCLLQARAPACHRHIEPRIVAGKVKAYYRTLVERAQRGETVPGLQGGACMRALTGMYTLH